MLMTPIKAAQISTKANTGYRVISLVIGFLARRLAAMSRRSWGQCLEFWALKRGYLLPSIPAPTGNLALPGVSTWWGTESIYTALGVRFEAYQCAPLPSIDSKANEQMELNPRNSAEATAYLDSNTR